MKEPRPSTTLLVIGVLALLAAFIAFPLTQGGYWYKHVPGKKDSRLFGVWTNGQTTLTFYEDGSGLSKRQTSQGHGRPFEWGIEDGGLRAKYVSVDYTQFPLMNYAVDHSGDRLAIAGKFKSSMFPSKLNRVRSASSK